MSNQLPAPKLSTLQRFTEVGTRTSLVVFRIRPKRSGNWDGACRSTPRKEFAAPSSGHGPTLGTSKDGGSDGEGTSLRFVLATYGTRGDVEPGAAVGLELMRRGHEVRMAVPPDLIGFAESAGLTPVVYGPDSHKAQAKDISVNLSKDFHRVWRIKDLARLWRENWELSNQCWSQMSTTLMSLADGAGMLITSMIFEDGAANIAEYYDIPLAILHYFPLRANGQLLPYLPAPLSR